MSFEFPLGLLGLIGIPIVIIIYIIKNKHTEQIVTSNYLWHLSEKFLTKKKPISLISGIISLILQIVAIAVISLLIAHPIIYIPNGAKEYCFILDGSGSMNMISNDKSRIEIGKDEIKKVINSSSDGSKYTLVYAGDTARVVYEKLGDKEKAFELLDKLEPSGVTVGYKNVLKYVQELFNVNNSMVTYLITDKDYTSSNIEIINVSNNEENYAIVNSDYIIENSFLKINGSVISYESNQTLEVEIYINDILETKLDVVCNKLEETNFEYTSRNIDFDSIKINIKNEDGLLLDNENIIYNVEKEHDYTTLVVSYRPFYIESMLKTVGNAAITVISHDNYDSSVSGYSLYIYDAVTPKTLPKDGTIWLFSPSESIDKSGFSVQDVVENEEGLVLSCPKNSTSMYKILTQGLSKDDIYVNKYYKYGLYKNFTTLLTHEGNPVVFTGTTDDGVREVVFGFDLHNSNLPLLMDYLILSKNLIDYSFPIILEEAFYVCGETVNINVLSNCDSIRVTSPKGNISYLDVSKEIAELNVTEVGTYTLTMMFDDDMKEFLVYSSLPNEEGAPSINVLDMSLQGELGNEYSNGIYDKLIILFIILAVVYVADWMVYCYEQYQLR